MKLKDLKIGQKVTIKGLKSIYLGIQKVKISSFGKAEKRVFKAEDMNVYRYYTLLDGDKTLVSEGIELI